MMDDRVVGDVPAAKVAADALSGSIRSRVSQQKMNFVAESHAVARKLRSVFK